MALDQHIALTGKQINKLWSTARRTNDLRQVEQTLSRMAGPRKRCMYCSDSLASDIEHFRPKAHYHRDVFAWPNLLLACTHCGRLKGDRFPQFGGRPALLDPTRDDPWRHLTFDPVTGILTAKFNGNGVPSRRGQATVDLLRLNRREELQEGYRKNYRRLLRLVDDVLTSPEWDDQSCVDAFVEADDHGLLGWCVGDAGARETHFLRLNKQRPQLWSLLRRAAR